MRSLRHHDVKSTIDLVRIAGMHDVRSANAALALWRTDLRRDYVIDVASRHDEFTLSPKFISIFRELQEAATLVSRCDESTVTNRGAMINKLINFETQWAQCGSAGRSFVRLDRPTAPPHVHLYCLPYAGGSAQAFQSWRDILPAEVAAVGVEYPGHGKRFSELAIDRIDLLANHLIRAVIDFSRGPYALFGHSMGALAAFEMSHQLAGCGAPLPILLVVSGHGSPSVPSTDRPVHASSDAEFLARLRELNATPPEVLETPELIELMMPMLRADFRAAETYVPANRPKLAIPIVAYGGLSDPDVSRDQLLAWADETTDRCTVRMFPGDHFFLRTARDKVVTTLARDLAEALRASTDAVTAGASRSIRR